MATSTVDFHSTRSGAASELIFTSATKVVFQLAFDCISVCLSATLRYSYWLHLHESFSHIWYHVSEILPFVYLWTRKNWLNFRSYPYIWIRF